MGNRLWCCCMDAIVTITEVASEAARTIGEAFGRYWPSSKGNDPAEANTVVHLAAAFMRRKLLCLAEVQYSSKARMDMLAIEPNKTWFVGCEQKRLLCNSLQASLESVRADIARIKSFSIINKNNDICMTGYGLVGGLYWVANGSEVSSPVDWWHGKGSSVMGSIQDELAGLNPVWLINDVQKIWDSGHYKFLLVCFEIPDSECD